jgi:pimeloyl-ACP methyl ester carboxylesterase
MAELMGIHYPLLPAVVLRYPLSTCQSAGRIDGPLLLVHGEQDRLIPIDQSERILSFAHQARLLRIAGAAHNDVHQFGAYTEGLFRVLNAL